MPKLTFQSLHQTVDALRGESILDAALRCGVPLYHTCGGNCSCSTCRVQVLEGAAHLTTMDADEAQVLDAFDLKAPHRLGCQALILDDVTVDIPTREREPRPNKTPKVPE